MTLLFPLRQPQSPHERDTMIMELALKQAEAAARCDEVPVAAIVVRGDRILGRGANQVESLQDATAHAEMLALTQAMAASGDKRLVDAELFCTLEPCIQCCGAILHSRISRVVYAASDPKFGGVESLLRIFDTEGLNHKLEYQGGVLADQSAALLREFFRAKRKN
ncbi:MAG: nucleoside deaminase [Planctomycetota bacterium]|jgi:tRNA(adenine34) deaminase|nr:nucleoside deaminase [Planctomycetota bacterium]